MRYSWFESRWGYKVDLQKGPSVFERHVGPGSTPYWMLIEDRNKTDCSVAYEPVLPDINIFLKISGSTIW
jgi:hypothetical protein